MGVPAKGNPGGMFLKKRQRGKRPCIGNQNQKQKGYSQRGDYNMDISITFKDDSESSKKTTTTKWKEEVTTASEAADKCEEIAKKLRAGDKQIRLESFDGVRA